MNKVVLQNKALEGVDPYDLELTKEQQQMILEECKNNPAYYFSFTNQKPTKESTTCIS